MARMINLLCVSSLSAALPSASSVNACTAGGCRPATDRADDDQVLLQLASQKAVRRHTGSSCTSEDLDPWVTGSHIPCCEGLQSCLKDWDGKGVHAFKCLPQCPGEAIMPEAQPGAPSVRLMSYNLMGWAACNVHEWRGANIFGKIDAWDPAVLGSQEVETGGGQGYATCAAKVEQNTDVRESGGSQFSNPSMVEKLEGGWTSLVQGYWMTMTRYKHKETGVHFLFFNSHWKHGYGLEQAQIVAGAIDAERKKYGSPPTILVGDINQWCRAYDLDAYQYLTGRIGNSPVTFEDAHWHDKGTSFGDAGDCRVDFILGSAGQWSVVHSYVDREGMGESGTASDHAALMAELAPLVEGIQDPSTGSSGNGNSTVDATTTATTMATTTPGALSCTAADNDPWVSGDHIPCCDGLNSCLKDWEGNGRHSFKCLERCPGVAVMPDAKDASGSIKVMSYNLMGWAACNVHEWRGANIFGKIGAWGPAVLGSQEVETGGGQGYATCAAKVEQNTDVRESGGSQFSNPSMVEKLEGGWTSLVQGYWMTMTRYKHKETGVHFLFFNSHWKHGYGLEQAQIVAGAIDAERKKYGSPPTILVGDINQWCRAYDLDAYKYLTGQIGHSPVTFEDAHWHDKGTSFGDAGDCRVDFIFGSVGQWSLVHSYVDREGMGESGTASDHAALMAELVPIGDAAVSLSAEVASA